MEDSPAPPPEGRTRWRRFAAAAIPSIAAAGALVTLMANGAIAASFAVSGQEFKVSGDSLDGSGFVQFGFVDASPSGPNKQDPHAVVVSGIKNATIHNLCQSVVTTLPIVGPISECMPMVFVRTCWRSRANMSTPTSGRPGTARATRCCRVWSPTTES